MKKIVFVSSLFMASAIPALAGDWQQAATPVGPVLVQKLAMFTVAAPLQYKVQLEQRFDPKRLGCAELKNEISEMRDLLAACAERGTTSVTCRTKGALLKTQTDLYIPVVFSASALSPDANAKAEIADALRVPDVELIIPENKMIEPRDLALRPTRGSDFEKVVKAFTAEGLDRFEAASEKVEVDNKLVACSILNGEAKIEGTVQVSGSIERSDSYKNVADIQQLSSHLQDEMETVGEQKDPFARGIVIGEIVAQWHSREPTTARLQYLLDLLTVDANENITVKDVSSFSTALDVLNTQHTFDLGVMPYIQGVQR
jgi:hypothetical protein